MDSAAGVVAPPILRPAANAAPLRAAVSRTPAAPAAQPAPEPPMAAAEPEPEVAEALSLAAEENAPATAAEPAVIRIVDPSVDEEELYFDFEPPAEAKPSITPPAYASAPATEHRRPPPSNPLPDPRVAPEKKGGFLSLFGGGRQAPPPPPPRQAPAPPPSRTAASGGAAAQPVPEAQQDGAEDLDIPSFLRRLAN
jgi:cell division protein FtsZ